tara:strand:+ start:15704 stop:17008 length:1305 start_codon:yes stop_codon:yes gene_type:complete
MENQKFFNSVLFTLFSTGIRVGARFLKNILFARFLGVEMRGLLSLFIFFGNTASLFLNLGLGHGIVFHRRKSNLESRELFGMLLLVSILMSSLFTLILYGCFSLNTNLSQNLIHLSDYWEIMGFYVFVLISNQYLIYLAIGSEHIYFQNLSGILASVMNLLLFLVGIFWTSFQAIDIAIISTISSLFIQNLMLSLVICYEKKAYSTKNLLNVFRDCFKIGKTLYWVDILQFLSTRVVYLYITSQLGFTSLGLYVIAMNLIDVLAQFPNNAFLPFIAKLYGFNKKEMGKFSSISHKYLFWTILIISIVFFICSNWIFTFLFGDKYETSSTPFNILLVGLIFSSCFIVLKYDFVNRDESKFVTISIISGFVFLLITSHFLIKIYGIQGAALSVTASQIINYLILLAFSLTRGHSKLKDLLLFTKNDLSTIKKFLKI